MEYSGAGGKLIQEKKSRDTAPLISLLKSIVGVWD